MRNTTKDMKTAAIRGVLFAGIALVIVSVFAVGDAPAARGVQVAPAPASGAVAGLLLSPSTRLIIGYQRTALA